MAYKMNFFFLYSFLQLWRLEGQDQVTSAFLSGESFRLGLQMAIFCFREQKGEERQALSHVSS